MRPIILLTHPLSLTLFYINPLIKRPSSGSSMKGTLINFADFLKCQN